MGAKEERQEAGESGGGLWGYLVFTSEKFVGGWTASQRPTSHESGTERTEPFTQLLLLVKL